MAVFIILQFGKYGIIREDNFFAKQREFEAYMSEVKGQPGIMGQGRVEVMKAFKDFIEDYNTATMPHEKVLCLFSCGSRKCSFFGLQK